MEDKEKIQALADIIQLLLQQVDLFTATLNEKDFELLEKAKNTLENHISRNMSALPIIMACGGNYDSMEDEMKLKTLDLLIELMKTRIEYREKLKEQQESNKNKETPICPSVTLQVFVSSENGTEILKSSIAILK